MLLGKCYISRQLNKMLVLIIETVEMQEFMPLKTILKHLVSLPLLITAVSFELNFAKMIQSDRSHDRLVHVHEHAV